MITTQNNVWCLIMTNKKLVLVVKICIALFWIICLCLLIQNYLFYNELSSFDLIEFFVICGFISIFVDIFYKKHLLITYFVCVYFGYIVYLAFEFYIFRLYRYISHPEYLIAMVKIAFVVIFIFGIIASCGIVFYLKRKYLVVSICFLSCLIYYYCLRFLLHYIL